MKNKSYLVNQICEISGVNPNSEEGQNLYNLKIIELMKKLQNLKNNETPVFFSNRCGCKL